MKQGENRFNRNARGLSGLSGVPVQAEGSRSRINTEEVVRLVQDEVFPYDRNWFRSEEGLTASLGRLNQLWLEIKQGIRTAEGSRVGVREVAAMTATARWMYESGLARRETRGMHVRTDFPERDAAQHYRLISGGLDQVWVKPITATDNGNIEEALQA